MKPYDFEVWYETYFGNIPQISFEQFVEVATVENKKEGVRTISEDMHQICLKYFKLEKQYKIQWSNFTKRAKKSDDGNYEDFWFYKKK